MKDSKIINWCGYEWTPFAEGGRLIHTNCPNYWYDPNCIDIRNDGIISFCIKESPREIKYWDGNVYYPFYGAPILRSVENFGYGTFSCDCKLPKGKYLWPAFWLSGHESWPPEIDIFEGYTENKGTYGKFLKWNVETNIHYKNKEEIHESTGAKEICKLVCCNPINTWNNYKCIWKPNEIKIYVNDYRVRTIKDENIIDFFRGNTMHVIFDFWLASSLHQYGTRLEKLPEQNFMIKNFKYNKD